LKRCPADTARYSNATPPRQRAPYSPSFSHASPPGHTFPHVPGSPAASHSSTVPNFQPASHGLSPARNSPCTYTQLSPLGPPAVAHEQSFEIRRLRDEVDNLHERLQVCTLSSSQILTEQTFTRRSSGALRRAPRYTLSDRDPSTCVRLWVQSLLCECLARSLSALAV
jgi:hypothetical protein